MRKAVVLVSGGLDSAVTLFFAAGAGYDPYGLAFDYGQRHKKELYFAKRITQAAGAKLKIVRLRLPWKGTSLLDKKMKLPQGRSPEQIRKSGIPSTS